MALSDYSVLFTCVGRRVEFIEQMKTALSGKVRVIAADVHAHAPALQFADKGATLPSITAPDFPGRLLDLCQAEQISHVFPLIDTELSLFAGIKSELSLFGVDLVVSDRSTIDLTRDKFSFGVFLGEKHIKTPRLIEQGESLDVFASFCVRPRFGSRSVGMKKVSGKEAESLLKRRDLVVTEWITGTEYSIDLLVDAQKQVQLCVPRERNLIRDGESVIGRTVRDEALISLAKHIVSLIPGLYGPLCLQLIKNENGLFVTELNARFGGGITLSIASGANFADWISAQVLKTDFKAITWQHDKKMYRYLKGFYVD